MTTRCNLLVVFAIPALLGAAGPRKPMTIRVEDSAASRWLAKKVLDSKLLDDMEDPSRWSFQGKGELTFTTERKRDGAHSLRLHTHAEPAYDPSSQVHRWVSANAVRRFEKEDWSRYNRLSFWVYADQPGFKAATLTARLNCADNDTLPEPYKRDSLHYMVLKNGAWNHVVWEIASVPRTKVRSLTFQYIMNGKEPDATGEITLDIDALALERVEPDYFEGWSVAPGKIAFSHTGYALGGSKTALASGLPAKEFQVIRKETGKAVLTKPVRAVKTSLGSFQVMDFSELREPGTYIVSAGAARTKPFRISADVWRDTVLKALNFFYAERCGMEIPGMHRACHGDWQCTHGNRRIIVNGGWHDAGDLSQGPVNTGEAAYAMLDLAARVRSRDPELSDRLLEEGKWGLEWLLKTTFGDGYRASFAAMSFWTDGVLGNSDDVVSPAFNIPYENFLAAATEALGAYVLRDIDPNLAAYSLKVARDDWRFAVAGMDAPERRARGARIDEIAAGALASLDLFRATGEAAYGEKARQLGGMLLDSQQRTFLPSAKPPLAGFFYTSPAKDRILHYEHRGHEQEPVVALARLCEAFPDHEDWIKWYAAVAFHSDYLKQAAAFNEPYGMLSASVYADDEYQRAPEDRRESYRRQILNGIDLGNGYHLRRFPVWYNMRGSHGTLLSQTKALSTAARLRGRPELADLAQRQLQWVVGRNPFSQSTMCGEGYDFTPLYTPSSGDMVGALPVGIQTRADADVPFFPPSNSYVYKEVWVHPAGRWIWIMSDLVAPARQARTGATFTATARSAGGGRVSIEVKANGSGIHRLAIRAENLDVSPGRAELDLTKSQMLKFQARVRDTAAPWVAVIVPDGDLSRKIDITAAALK